MIFILILFPFYSFGQEFSYMELLDYQDNLLNHELERFPERDEEIAMACDLEEFTEEEGIICQISIDHLGEVVVKE